MTRKDYVLIAKVINGAHPIGSGPTHKPRCETLRNVAEQMAVQLRQDNPNFDRARFIAACGLVS